MKKLVLLLIIVSAMIMGCQSKSDPVAVYRLASEPDGEYKMMLIDLRELTLNYGNINPYKENKNLMAMVDSAMSLKDTIIFVLDRRKLDIKLNDNSTITVIYTVVARDVYHTAIKYEEGEE